jgi:HlyD family secretion protein
MLIIRLGKSMGVYTMKIKLIVLSILIVIGIIISGLFFYIKQERYDRNFLTLYGNVDIRQVDLGFRVFGKVKKLFFDEGDVIKPTNLVATLDDVPYLEEAAKAKAKVLEYDNFYRKANAKFQKRFHADPDAISKEDYDDSFYTLEESRANLEAAQAAYDRALTNLGDTRLYCPNEGIILTRIREPGSVLNPGEPVFTISLTELTWIRAYISEPDLGNITFGMKAKVITDTKELGVYNGQIGFISPVAEFTPKTVESLDLRTDLVYRIRVIVDDPNQELKQGMPVTIKIKKK